MDEKPKVHIIPARLLKRELSVGIYCRVSTNKAEQLKSLSAQVSSLTRLTAFTPTWLLVDIYMDISTSKTGASSRNEFTRMLDDCRRNKLDIILTKSISRFGRDTVEVLAALNELKGVGTRVIFEQEGLDTEDAGSELMISIIESIAQAENESRSGNIKWGITKRVADGTSKLYNRKCYGYKNDTDGNLIIDKDEAKNVKIIFELYLEGSSVIGILKELENRGIKSPTGKDKWSKRTIDVMLINEKYIGNVRLLNNREGEAHYLAKDSIPAIISEDTFKEVQREKLNRSNVIKGEIGNKRKSTKYSSKNKKVDEK